MDTKSISVDLVIRRLNKVSGPDRTGWYTALCPFHDDRRKPNLRFRQTGFKCMACGEKGGLKKLAQKLGIEEAKPKQIPERIVATYDYQDENNNFLFQVARYEPKTFRQRRPDGNGDWIWNIEGVRRVVYRLPQLLATPGGKWVFLVEGEKDADALVERGQAATCSPMGAGKWREEYRQPFRGRKVAVLSDNDEPGQAHAHQVATSLIRIASCVKVIVLPNLERGQDIYDWLAKGNSIEDLLRLTEVSPTWQSSSGHEVLDAIVAFILRFVVLSQCQAEAIALWVLHTHALEAAEATPYLNITSPEKRSGKTRLLETLELLVARPWFTGRVTPAVLARKVDLERPTLLLDESDAAFKSDKEYAEALRSILNTGYRRGGKSSLCVGQGAAIGYKDLSTFCPKAIAGIGKLPDTVADRSIPIVLKRRAPNEQIERFRQRNAEQEASLLRQQIIQFLSVTPLSDTEPDIPQELDDRAADCWEPLLAIADAAGDDWPRRAREAARALMTGEDREDESLGVQLLADIKLVFEENPEQISSADLVSALIQIEESPWGDMHGKPINARRLARLLKPYGIRPQTIRIDDKTPKGYRQADFQDVWMRYLYSDLLSATAQHAATAQLCERAPKYPQQTVPEVPDVADNSQSHPEANVADVADKTPGREGNEEVFVFKEGQQWEMEI